MPHFKLSLSTAKVDDADRALHGAIAAAIVSTYNKPLAVCFVEIVYGASLSFGGSADPCAVGQLDGIGAYAEDVNENFAGAVVAAIEAQTGIPKDRAFVKFCEYEADHWTLGGTTIRKRREEAARKAAEAAKAAEATKAA